MWRRLLATVLGLPGVAFLLAAIGDPAARPIAIVTLVATPAAIAIGRWRARHRGHALTLADYLRLGASGPAAALLTIVALENEPALKLAQAAIGGGLFGFLAATSGVALAYVHTQRLPGARGPRSDHTAGAVPLAGRASTARARGRVVDERVEGVTGRTEQECPHCGGWTLLAHPICRECGRSTIDTPVGTR